MHWLIKRFLFTVFLSAAEIPQSDVQKSEEVSPTLATTLSPTNKTDLSQTTKADEASKVSENASVESTDTLPPLEFPSDEISPKNDTALKILQSVSSQTVKASEVITDVRFIQSYISTSIWNMTALISNANTSHAAVYDSLPHFSFFQLYSAPTPLKLSFFSTVLTNSKLNYRRFRIFLLTRKLFSTLLGDEGEWNRRRRNDTASGKRHNFSSA